MVLHHVNLKEIVEFSSEKNGSSGKEKKSSDANEQTEHTA